METMLIVTGLSGAGKTQAMRSLEDLNFFCVDNLPPALIPKFTELCAQSNRQINNIALAVDIRGGDFFNPLLEVLEDLGRHNSKYDILFLEASDETLVRRYKETRRHHPLRTGDVLSDIRRERALLQELRGMANKIIDTSDLTPQQLRAEVGSLFGEDTGSSRLQVSLVSFGYKYGLPLDSDLVIDVRFLPNPHYLPDLRSLTGNDRVVQDYVFGHATTLEFMQRFTELIEFLIPQYITEGKTTLTIAIGCTGGMHRSVSLANRLGEFLQGKEYRVSVRHRDITRR